jgi:hypothetical protein
MTRAFGFALLTGFVLGSAVHAEAGPAASSRGPRFQSVTLLMRHRVFHDFQDRRRVRLNQDFLLGDTDYSGRVVEYLPDFEMDLDTRRTFSRSDQPNNPAFKIVVRKGKVPQDTSWAFLNMPPHFGRRAYYAFQVVRIDFADRAPLLADTNSVAPSAPPAPAVPPMRGDSASMDTARRR